MQLQYVAEAGITSLTAFDANDLNSRLEVLKKASYLETGMMHEL